MLSAIWCRYISQIKHSAAVWFVNQMMLRGTIMQSLKPTLWTRKQTGCLDERQEATVETRPKHGLNEYMPDDFVPDFQMG